MLFVICPCCNARVEVPATAVGPDRADSWNVVSCDDCDAAFNYDDEDVIEEGEPFDGFRA